MTTIATGLTQRERELGAIISSYNQVTEQLTQAHRKLQFEVGRLREQLELTNRELARKERLAALGEMAAGLAHEIRNPLGGIQLFASLLERDLVDQPPCRDLARKISNGVSALDHIVTDVLAFAGDSPPSFTSVDLVEVIGAALELAGLRIEKKSASVAFDRSAGEFIVQADPNQMQRAVLNLIFNALDAMPVGGRVNVELSRAGDDPQHVVIDVMDDGPGLPAELLNKVFDPFYTTKDSGTGLGLAIVHRIVESHGGSIRAGNRPEGGALFSMRLPAGTDLMAPTHS